MIHTIDLHFLGQRSTIGAFLVETAAGPVLVESGPYSTFGVLEEALDRHGYKLADIGHVLLTHIHFDHAGAAWALAEAGARIYVHPVGLRHLAQPGRLVASAKRIYGEKMEVLWGDMKPIPEGLLRAVLHGEAFDIGGVVFTAWHTPGHAKHHIAWQCGKALFAGDVAGIRMGQGPVVPPCPPPDIDVEAWQASIALLKGLDLVDVYLTHFGRVVAWDGHLEELESSLLAWAEWMRPYVEQGAVPEEVVPIFEQYVRDELVKEGLVEEVMQQYVHANPPSMSVAGLMRYWHKRLAS